MKAIAFALILSSLAIMRISGNTLCTEVVNEPVGCLAACGTFPYECTTDGICICTGQTEVNGTKVDLACENDDFVTASQCGLLCVGLNTLNLGIISTSNCDGGICHCVYDL